MRKRERVGCSDATKNGSLCHSSVSEGVTKGKTEIWAERMEMCYDRHKDRGEAYLFQTWIDGGGSQTERKHDRTVQEWQREKFSSFNTTLTTVRPRSQIINSKDRLLNTNHNQVLLSFHGSPHMSMLLHVRGPLPFPFLTPVLTKERQRPTVRNLRASSCIRPSGSFTSLQPSRFPSRGFMNPNPTVSALLPPKCFPESQSAFPQIFE